MTIRVGLILMLLSYLLLSSNLRAEGEIDTMKTLRIRHEVGFAAGFTISYGPAYKIRMNRFAAMGTFAPFVRYNIENYSAGLSFQYMIQSTPVSNLFVYQGNRILSSTQYDNTWNLPPLSPLWMKETFKEYLFSHSLGLGYEMFRRPGKKNPLGFSLMAGWAVYDNFNAGMLTAEMSIMYKFNKD
jgi:hypothetical protein